MIETNIDGFEGKSAGLYNGGRETVNPVVVQFDFNAPLM
jgi:hypothetical protein